MVGEPDDRRHLRIQEEIPIKWLIEARTGYRDGLIRDISSSGMLVEIELLTTPRHNLIMKFEPVNEDDLSIHPKSGKIVWFKRMKTKPNFYLCGVEFVNPTAQFMAYMQLKLEKWLLKFAKASNVNILKNYIFPKN